MKRVLLPRDNEKDLLDLPAHVCKEMTFLFADTVADVLAAALPRVLASLPVAA